MLASALAAMLYALHCPRHLLERLEEIRRSAGIEATRARIERIERIDDRLDLHHDDGKTSAARRVIVAIGRGGDHRRLNVPGEDSGKVFNRLFDPSDFAGRDVLVVGGGDSALEAAIALESSGARVALSYRKAELSRPKPENIERVRRGSVRLLLGTEVVRIGAAEVGIRDSSGRESTIPNDIVFSMIGREAPLDFFRRSGIRIRGELGVAAYAGLAAFLVFCALLFNWKSRHPEVPIQSWVEARNAFPYGVPAAIGAAGGKIADWSNRETNLLFTVRRGLGNPAFYYTLVYCALVAVFGVRRIRRRKTRYVTLQTLTLIAIQCVPLFLLPEILLPWMGRNGFFSHGGASQWLADHLFERYDAIGHERAYWRSYGFVLAFPLNVYNVFTDRPMWLWLAICFVQTFVIIPLLDPPLGKGRVLRLDLLLRGAGRNPGGCAPRRKCRTGRSGTASTWWARRCSDSRFCSSVCGSRVGLAGRESWPDRAFRWLFDGVPFLNYSWSVDIFLAGILGVGFYFWFSGRVWCRFACPLAALMHVYARFSKFRIFAEKSKCISCNVCTSVCHQGIDVMSFANKGVPDGGSRMRALLRVRSDVPDRGTELRACRSGRPSGSRPSAGLARAGRRVAVIGRR